MSRINTNVQSLIAQRVLGQNNSSLASSLERLSTGLRINRGKDDPAGLIASENLRAEKAALTSAIGNAERAEQVTNIAEGGLQEISSLLTELQGLVTSSANSAGLSSDEKEANQLQIDSILQTIDRIADSTNFQGTKLLNGNFDFTADSVSAGVADFKINGAKLSNGANMAVQALVTTSAQQAGLYLSTGATLDLNNSGDSFTIEVSGAKGSRELSFASGTTVAQMVAAVNTFTDVTGVSASAGAGGFKLISSEYGSEEFVSVKIVDDASINTNTAAAGVYGLTANDFATPDAAAQTLFSSSNAGNGVRDAGQDIEVTINGIAATSKGKTASINTDFLNVEINFSDATGNNTAQTLGQVNAFTITGGGADFQLAANVDIAGKVSLGIADVATRKLGGSEVGFLDDLASGNSMNVVNGDVSDAQRVVEAAIQRVSSLRGRLGAFQKNTVGATIRSLGVTFENTAAAESSIRDADFASETAALTRSQILASAATNSLALANSQPQAALQLLG